MGSTEVWPFLRLRASVYVNRQKSGPKCCVIRKSSDVPNANSSFETSTIIMTPQAVSTSRLDGKLALATDSGVA